MTSSTQAQRQSRGRAEAAVAVVGDIGCNPT
ncbi:uncharacterized protein FFB14_09000 [Fusarium fujikuroi]|nr:uncharacterized protein FFB14_09000 [Fusarium fujikuroi]